MLLFFYTVPDTIKGCQPYPVSFTNPLPGATVFHWDFGVPWLTNDTSNVANPTLPLILLEYLQ